MFEELHAQPMAVHCYQDNWSSQGHNKAIIPAQRTIPSLSQKGPNNSQKTTCFIIPLRVQKHQNKNKSKQNPEGALQCLSSSVLYGSILFNPIFSCKRPMQNPCPQLVKTMLQNLVVATFLRHTKPKVLCYRLPLSLSQSFVFFSCRINRFLFVYQSLRMASRIGTPEGGRSLERRVAYRMTQNPTTPATMRAIPHQRRTLGGAADLGAREGSRNSAGDGLASIFLSSRRPPSLLPLLLRLLFLCFQHKSIRSQRQHSFPSLLVPLNPKFMSLFDCKRRDSCRRECLCICM